MSSLFVSLLHPSRTAVSAALGSKFLVRKKKGYDNRIRPGRMKNGLRICFLSNVCCAFTATT